VKTYRYQSAEKMPDIKEERAMDFDRVRRNAVAALSTVTFFVAVASILKIADGSTDYFPLPESQGGWRTLDNPDDIRRLAGMNPDKLAELKEWLFLSDDRSFAAVVRRRGFSG
jgi:hypothetical protein